MSKGRPNGDIPPSVTQDCRILRRVEVREGPTGEGDPADAPFVGIAIDVETTGLTHSDDRIIELALRRFRYDRNGVITNIDRPYSWLEDPGRPLQPEIVRLTGLTDTDLKSIPYYSFVQGTFAGAPGFVTVDTDIQCNTDANGVPIPGSVANCDPIYAQGMDVMSNGQQMDHLKYPAR